MEASLCQVVAERSQWPRVKLSRSSEAGEYTWRHDCALKTLVNGLRGIIYLLTSLTNGLVTTPPATILTDTLDSSVRPDIVVTREREIFLLQLTIPHNSPESIANAKELKENKENCQFNLL